MVETPAGLRRNYDNCSGCVPKSNEDQFFHGLLKTVSKKMGGDVSLFDIPKLYNPRAVKTYTEPEIIPIYTICELDPESPSLVKHLVTVLFGFTSDCTVLWNSYIQDSENPAFKNPYQIAKNGPLGLCAKPIGDIAK